MNPHIARGVLASKLRPFQIKDAVEFESKQPEGRYLMPFEIARFVGFNCKIAVSNEEQGMMQKMWVDFCRANNLDQECGIDDHAIAAKWMYFANGAAPLTLVCGVVVPLIALFLTKGV